MIFNPSFPYRLSHTLVAFFITTAFVVIGVSAWHLRRNEHVAEARKALSMGLLLMSLLVPLLCQPAFARLP